MAELVPDFKQSLQDSILVKQKMRTAVQPREAVAASAGGMEKKKMKTTARKVPKGDIAAGTPAYLKCL